MLRLEKVAAPFTAATLAGAAITPAVQVSAPNATVTLPTNPVAVFPNASCALTCTAGVIAAPASALLGCTVNTSCCAAAGETPNGALVTVRVVPPIVAAA